MNKKICLNVTILSYFVTFRTGGNFKIFQDDIFNLAGLALYFLNNFGEAG